MGIEIVALTPGHLPDVARVHLRAFPGAGLTRLGPEAVRRYYEWQLLGPHDVVALGAWDGPAGLVGFCFGGVFRGALSGFLRANRAFLVCALLTRPWLCASAVVRDRGFRGITALRRSTKPKRPAAAMSQPAAAAMPSFGLLAIAVDSARTGQGIGRELMVAVEAAAAGRGFERMALTVDPANVGAIAFYERSGWARTATSPVWHGAMEKRVP